MLIKPEEEIRVLLTKELANKITSLAEEHDVTVGSYIRDALETHLKFQKTSKNKELREDLKSLIGPLIEQATNWIELNELLAEHSYQLKPKFKGVALYDLNNKFVAPGGAVGASYRKLVLKFNSGHPDHKFEDIADRILELNK